MTKITGAMLAAIKRSKMTEAEILAALAPKDAADPPVPAVTDKALNGARKKRAYTRRDMRADA